MLSASLNKTFPSAPFYFMASDSVKTTHRILSGRLTTELHLSHFRPASACTKPIAALWYKGRKEMFYLTTCPTHFIYGYMASDMVKDHSDNKIGHPLPPHGLLFPISSRGSFICTIPQTGWHIPRPLLHQSWGTGWNAK